MSQGEIMFYTGLVGLIVGTILLIGSKVALYLYYRKLKQELNDKYEY